MLRALFSRSLNLIWLQNLALLAAYTLVGALLPLFIRQSGLSDSTNGLILGTGSLGLLVSLLLMGRWIDLGEPRRYMAGGAFLWAATSALLAMLQSTWVLVVCRFLQGFAYALFYTAALVYATRSVGDEYRGTVVGMIEAVGAFSIALTPFLAFPLAAAWGYPVAFWLAAACSLLVLLTVPLLAARLPPPIEPDPQSGNPATPSATRFLSRHALLPGSVAASLFCVAIAYINLAPLIGQRVGVASISLYMGLRAMGTVPTRLLSGFIADRKSASWAIVTGLLVALLGLSLLPFLAQPGWAYLVPALFGLGMGSASPALTAWMLKRVPAGERAVAINTFTIMTEGSGFLGSWLVGALLQSGDLAGFLLLPALLGVGLIIYFLGSKAA